jgi:hypothetical protein
MEKAAREAAFLFVRGSRNQSAMLASAAVDKLCQSAQIFPLKEQAHGDDEHFPATADEGLG